MIIPTILEKEKAEILQKINLVDGIVPHYQIDFVDPAVFDGETYLKLDFLSEIELESTVELDLMVKTPIDYLDNKIPSVSKIMANILGDNIEDFIKISSDMGYITGITVNTDSDVTHYYRLLDSIDFIQFMGIVPGAQGRSFDPKVLDQISEFKKEYPDIPIQVDGGIKLDTVKDLVGIGVNSLVIGSAIFNNKDPVESYKILWEEYKKYAKE